MNDTRNFQKEATDLVVGMVRDTWAGYMLLELPNGQWAAFWEQGIDGPWAEQVAIGNYEVACAFVGGLYETARYIQKEKNEILGEYNLPGDIYYLNPHGLLASTLRSRQ